MSRASLAPAPRFAPTPRFPMHVLIIDDYPSYGESLAEMVEVLGHRALYVPDYSAATEYLASIEFQVALVDWNMPRLAGPEVALELATHYPTIRPVIMSSVAPSEAERRAIERWLFLAKPVKRDDLLALLGPPAASSPE